MKARLAYIAASAALLTVSAGTVIAHAAIKYQGIKY